MIARTGIVAVVVAIAVGVVACGPPDRDPRWRAAGATSPRRGGTLRIAMHLDVRTLDPAIAYDEGSTYVAHPLFATLVTYEPHGVGLVPDLAERWELDPGGTTYRFFLRDGLAYHDGRPIVAGDFKFALERALTSPDSPFGQLLVDVVGASDVLAGKATDCAGIVAVTDRELRIQVTRPSPAFLAVLTMPFATPQRADHVAAVGTQLRRTPLASGPFMLDSWDEGTKVVLRRNPHYWDPARPYLDALEIYENVPTDTQFLMFERGELDTAARLASADYVWILAQPAWAPYLHQATLMQVFASRMNVTRPPFDDRRVRQALNYALDKGHLEKLLNNAAVPSHGMLPPGMFGRDETLLPYPHDPAKARALLAEAGHADGFDLDYVTQNDEVGEKLAVSLQGDLAEVGVRVHIQLVSFATLATVLGREDGPAFSLTSWIGDFPDPTNFLDVRFHSRASTGDNATNDTRYRNPELDTLLDAARGELDPKIRAGMYQRAERILYEDAPWIYAYHPIANEITQPYVRGFELHPIWLRDYANTWLDLDEHGERVPR